MRYLWLEKRIAILRCNNLLSVIFSRQGLVDSSQLFENGLLPVSDVVESTLDAKHGERDDQPHNRQDKQRDSEENSEKA